MNTETGRIYEPEEYRQRLAGGVGGDVFAALAEAERADAERKELREQLEFERALAAGRLVEVSAPVAQQVKLGQRELERRKSRRKASKAARKHGRR